MIKNIANIDVLDNLSKFLNDVDKLSTSVITVNEQFIKLHNSAISLANAVADFIENSK